MQEPQQRPQLGDLPLRRPQTHPTALAQQKPGHHGAIEVAHTELVCLCHSRGQEPAGERLIPKHRHRRQPTIGEQPLAVVVDQQLERRELAHGLREHRPGLAQIATNWRSSPKLAGRRSPPARRAARNDSTAARSKLPTSTASLSIHRPSCPSTFSIPRTVSGVYPCLEQPDSITHHERGKPSVLPARTRHRHRLLAETRVPTIDMASRDAKLCRQAGRRDQRETQRNRGVQPARGDDVGIVAVSAQVDLCGYPHRSTKSATSHLTPKPPTSCSASSATATNAPR